MLPLLLATVCAVVVAVAVAVVRAEWTVQLETVGTLVVSVDFVDERVGWSAGFSNVVGNRVFKTEDGGETMRNVLVQEELLSFILFGTAAQSNASMVGCGYGLAALSAGLFTRDGGETWAMALSGGRALNGYAQSCTASPGCYYFMGVFWKPDESTYGVARSCDGGENYDVLDWGKEMMPHYASFLNDTYGFVAGGNYPTEAGEEEESVLDDYLGRRSLLKSLGLSGGGRGGGRETKKSVLDYEASIARTKDGGETFEEVFYDEGKFYFNQIHFANDLVGVAVGVNNHDRYGVIYKTSDGGNTWRMVFETDRSLYAIRMVDEREGWAAGATFALGLQAYMLRTQDGGETWEEYATDLPYYIGEFSAVDADHVWAMAFNVQAKSSLLQWIPED